MTVSGHKALWLSIAVMSVAIVFYEIISSALFTAPAVSAPARILTNQHKNLNVALKVPLASGVGAPIRLEIPSIKVDAMIEYVGRTPAGAMDVPKDPGHVAWFDLGPRPGEVGSAVLAGHRDWYNGASAVFARLSRVRIGDTITVTDTNGRKVLFIVRETRTVAANADASEVFTSSSGIHLNLVTCTGVWSRANRIYTQRLVVFADAQS